MKHQNQSIPTFLLAAALAFPVAAQAADMPPPPEAGRPMPCMPHEPGERAPGGPGPGLRHPGEMGGEPPFLRGLALSEAQQDKVFAILHAQAPLLREQHKAAASAHEALHALTRADKFDEGKAGALAQSASQAMARIALLHARAEQQMLALLTPEQRKQLEQRGQDGPQRPPRPE